MKRTTILAIERGGRWDLVSASSVHLLFLYNQARNNSRPTTTTTTTIISSASRTTYSSLRSPTVRVKRGACDGLSYGRRLIIDFFRIQRSSELALKPSKDNKKRRKCLVISKKKRRLLPFNPSEDHERRLHQMASLATALTTTGTEFCNDLTYMPGMAPRSANCAALEGGGMQVLSREDAETLKMCKTMMGRGQWPPLTVVFDPKEGFTVEADRFIKDLTIITEYTGDVDYLSNREHDEGDSMMTLLSASDPSKSLVICPDKHGNIARFINGINNHTLEGKKKQNLKCVRYNVDGECRVLLIANRDISKGERLYYDYNGLEHEYPTHHFKRRKCLVLSKRKKKRRLFPFNPTEDHARRLEQMASLATALSATGTKFSDELTYMHGMAPRSANCAALEDGGMQVLSREDIETLSSCKKMMERGECPPLMVVFDSKEGFTVEADRFIKDLTIVTEYTGDVDYLMNREHDDGDSMMTLLSAKTPSQSLVICPDKCGNIARFINGINNHTPLLQGHLCSSQTLRLNQGTGHPHLIKVYNDTETVQQFYEIHYLRESV
ncbi:hypothetical protein Syun_007412 [Stephania yunnanensis]|uniref:[histone H3]-lysine(27) N-methyltransferase n=1 Tax=Stephania yunnanensis TaxID=152371 RepID=A0AAP0KYQ1_9MAGN